MVTLRQNVCLNPAASSLLLWSTFLYSLNASATCSGLSFGSKPIYNVVHPNQVSDIASVRELLTLCNIPASALAVYAPRENPKMQILSPGR
jgi:hypothetical protein